MMTTPKLTVSVTAEIRASNGALISVTERAIHLSTPGPRGGSGHQVVIPLTEWDAVHNAVTEVRAALARASQLKEEIER